MIFQISRGVFVLVDDDEVGVDVGLLELKDVKTLSNELELVGELDVEYVVSDVKIEVFDSDVTY